MQKKNNNNKNNKTHTKKVNLSCLRKPITHRNVSLTALALTHPGGAALAQAQLVHLSFPLLLLSNPAPPVMRLTLYLIPLLCPIWMVYHELEGPKWPSPHSQLSPPICFHSPLPWSPSSSDTWSLLLPWGLCTLLQDHHSTLDSPYIVSSVTTQSICS